MSDAEISTASQLFAIAHGEQCAGRELCFYCGAPCDERFSTTRFLKNTFTDWSIVSAPHSKHVCAGCVLSMNEKAEMPGRDKFQKFRNYSWIVERTKATPYSKGEIAAIRGWCLEPPDPPFAIVLATSGQKHLMFRAPACQSRESVVAQLEAERVSYRPAQLAERLRFVGRLVAALGKPALAERFTPGSAFRAAEYWTDGAALLHEWERIGGEPLSRLAIFLAPNKDNSQHDYPSDRDS